MNWGMLPSPIPGASLEGIYNRVDRGGSSHLALSLVRR